jgi:hypothetical protein
MVAFCAMMKEEIRQKINVEKKRIDIKYLRDGRPKIMGIFAF